MLTINYLGHSCFKISNEKVSFVIDPYQNNSVPGLSLKDISSNYVFVSHEHQDHNARSLVKIIPSTYKIDYQTVIVPHDHHNGVKRGMNKIHIFHIDGYKIVHLGDIGYVPNEDIISLISNADILLGPINGFYTISAEEFKDIINLAKPRIAIPMHYNNLTTLTGYPDGGQINIFKRLFPHYFEVNNNKLSVDDELFSHQIVIFK